jgi:endonuclease III related protein
MNFGKSPILARLNLNVTPAAREQSIRSYYQTLYASWGPQHWWPARTRLEVVVGAYLTQNTSWTNVEIALRRLRQAHLLSLAAIRRVPLPQLEAVIRSSGYFRQKAARLKTFVGFVDERYGGSLRRMFAQSTHKLRQELLDLNGIGPETADSILLYAGQQPVFVVDAYTRRILERHAILPADSSYEEIRELFERSLADQAPLRTVNGDPKTGLGHPPSTMSLAQRSPMAQVYNDLHGLIVRVGKHHCLKSKPRCEECPLRRFLP